MATELRLPPVAAEVPLGLEQETWLVGPAGVDLCAIEMFFLSPLLSDVDVLATLLIDPLRVPLVSLFYMHAQ